MAMRLLITGSRNWTNRDQMYRVLEVTFNQFFSRDRDTILVHGDARGADRIAADVWEKQGLPTEAHPADWNALGRRAGVVRNQKMVDLGADYLVAFMRPESIGTKHCIKIAQEAGIPTYIVYEE